MTKSPQGTVSIQDRILNAAETLYADYGLSAVSLRQISAAAGARNTNAVQYHFGDADNLVRAILRRRAPEWEIKRGQLLAIHLSSNSAGTRDLLEVLYRPVLEADTRDHVPVAARFLLVLMATPNGWQPIVDVFMELPVTRQVMDLIAQANPQVPAPVTWQRLLYSGIALITYAVNAGNITRSYPCYEAAVSDAFNMASTALNAPPAEDTDILSEAFEQYFSNSPSSAHGSTQPDRDTTGNQDKTPG